MCIYNCIYYLLVKIRILILTFLRFLKKLKIKAKFLIEQKKFVTLQKKKKAK